MRTKRPHHNEREGASPSRALPLFDRLLLLERGSGSDGQSGSESSGQHQTNTGRCSTQMAKGIPLLRTKTARSLRSSGTPTGARKLSDRQNKFARELDSIIGAMNLEITPGVSLEIAHFIPAGWSTAIREGGFVVRGPGDQDWDSNVTRLIGVLAYAEGSLVRRSDARTVELYTWRNPQGTGFKVTFEHSPEQPATGQLSQLERK